VRAYLPSGPETVWALVVVLACTLVVGFSLSRLRQVTVARAAAWALLVVSVFGAERLCATEPPGVRMLAVIAVLFVAMKAVVSVEAQVRLGAFQWFLFATWPGMRPAIFASRGGPPLVGAGRLCLRGLARLGVGACFIALARVVVLWRGSSTLASVPLLLGLSLAVHFGLFNLMAGGWRYLGVDATPLFQAPLYSRSLREFWGRRWNLAFSEMTALAVYRPVSAHMGRPAGLGFAFLASGLLHELALSVPVKAGFGLPLLYFVLHGFLMMGEASLERSGHPISSHAVLGRVWTVFWLTAPLPLLFHPPFLRGVVWPLLGEVQDR